MSTARRRRETPSGLPESDARRPTWFTALVTVLTFAGACAAPTPTGVARRPATPNRVASRPVPTSTPAPSGSATPSSNVAPPATAPIPPQVDASRLATLVEASRNAHSDALVLEHRGKLLVDEGARRGELIETMSIAKSVLSLGVGVAVDRGLLRLEQPLGDFFPLPPSSPHAKIRLHHLLSHTSGIAKPKSTATIRHAPGIVEDALSAKLESEPGERFEYSNRGANLVSGILQKAVGMPADALIAREIFEPLGIRRYEWRRDRRGPTYGMDGLKLSPDVLLALGRLVAKRGLHEGKHLVSESWLERSTTSAEPVAPTHRQPSLFWWLLPRWVEVSIDDTVLAAWREGGVPEEVFSRTAPLHRRVFSDYASLEAELKHAFADDSLTLWHESTWKRGVADVGFRFGATVGTQALGTAGQYLVILPADELVAVRLHVVRSLADRDDDVVRFLGFPQQVVDLLYCDAPRAKTP